VVAENRTGAGGSIGSAAVLRESPDGYTLLANSSAHVANPSIYAKLPYDTLKDFANIAPLAGGPNVLIVGTGTGWKKLGDFIAAAKSKPGALNFSSAGIGSGTHFNAEKFKLAAGIDVVHVPYKGTPEALTDTLSGRVQYFFSPISAALAMVRDGRLVALAVSSGKRSGLLPHVPTVAEAGLPGFDYNLWVGVFAPAGTPADVVDKIGRSVNRVLDAADVKERMASLGAEAMTMTPAEFDKFVRAEMDDASKVVKAAGIKAQ
jgi:tripartite-type tricarboxylate transporter receptor subunit TctC